MRTVVIALALVAAMSAGAAEGADRFVSTRGDDQGGANPCNPAPCKTIAQAVAKASSGDVIKVARGTYKGSVVIASSAGTWTIRGGYGQDLTEANRNAVKNKTTVTGAKNSRFLLLSAGPLANKTVTLDGLFISNSKLESPTTEQHDRLEQGVRLRRWSCGPGVRRGRLRHRQLARRRHPAE